MLEADGLVKDYGGVRAVDGVDLELAAGRIVGLVGNNGAGKTTTLKMLCGLVQPTAGTVRLAGADPMDPPVRQRLGYLPEESPLYDEQTPLQYLAFFASLYGLDRPPARKRAHTLLTRLRLEEVHWSKHIGELSKGSVRKVAIARALLHDPPVLVLDEPTSGLDPQSRRDLDRFLSEMAGAGKHVLLSAHDMRQVEELCHHILVMDRGRIVTRGDLRDLRRKWGRTRYSVRADAPFAGSRPDGAVHTRTVGSWAEAEQAMADVRAAGAEVVDVHSQPPRLEEILEKAVA